MSFVIEHDWSFFTNPRTNSTTSTPQTQVGSSGFYDWIGGLWSTQGTGILSCPVNTPGSYSVAPTITFGSTGKGSGSHFGNAVGTVTLSGGGLGAVVLSQTGYDYVSATAAPTLSGGTGSGGVLGLPVLAKTVGAGTLSCVNGNPVVAGSGTSFTTDVSANEDILINGVLYNILSISSNISLTLSTNFGQTTAASLAYSYGGVAVGPYQNLNAVPNISGGYPGVLVRPASTATVDQQIDVYFYPPLTGGGATTVAVLRYNSAIGTYGEQFNIYCNSSNIIASHFDGTATQATLAAGGAPSSWIPSHLMKLTASAVNSGTSTCTLTGTLTDITASNTVVGSVTITVSTSSTYPNLASAGQIGVSSTPSGTAITRITTYNTVGIAASPTIANLNVTSQTETVTGLGVTWTPGTPGSPLFTISSGASIVSQVVNSSTSATVVISTGSAGGVATITDPSTGFTAPITLQVITPPITLSNITTLNPTGATFTASTFATFGNAPLSYKLYRCPRTNFNRNDADSVLVSTQTGVALSTLPTPVVDSSVTVPGNYFWAWVVTDANGQVSQGKVIGWYVPKALATPSQMLFIGDSLTNGFETVPGALCQQINAPAVLSTGSGQTDGLYDLIFTGGLGTGFAGKAVISGGLLTRAYMTKQGYGQTSNTTNLPTITYSGAGGTPGTLSANVGATGWQGAATPNTGGGFPLAMSKIMQELYQFPYFIALNGGVGSSTTDNWVTDSGGIFSNAMNLAPSSTTCPYVHIMLGTNDAGTTSTAPSVYGTSMASLVALLISRGFKILLSYPIYAVGRSQVTNSLVQQYQAQIDTIIAANPGLVFAGWQTSVFGQTINSAEAFGPDGLHLNDYGYTLLGAAIAKIAAVCYGLPGAFSGGAHNSLLLI